jgi:hypothetical protein
VAGDPAPSFNCTVEPTGSLHTRCFVHSSTCSPTYPPFSIIRHTTRRRMVATQELGNDGFHRNVEPDASAPTKEPIPTILQLRQREGTSITASATTGLPY